MLQRVDRFQVEPPSEVRPYLLTPEESRTHFKPREDKQTWFDLRLMHSEKMPAERLKAAGKIIFISKGINDSIFCSFYNECGHLDGFRVNFFVSGPLKISAEMKEHILEEAIKSGRIPASSEIMYRGVPCVMDTEWSPEKEAIASKLPASKDRYFIVPEGSIGKIMINGRAEFVRPGKHILMNDNIKNGGYESLSNKRIMHGNRCILTVTDEEYVYAHDPFTPAADYKLLTLGIHILEKKLTLATILEPYALDVKVRFDNGVEKILFSKISQGKIGVALDQDPQMQHAPIEARLRILDQGVNEMNTMFSNEVLETRVSSKMGTLECKLSAVNQRGKEVNVSVNLQYKLEKDNVFYTYKKFYNKHTKDSITKAIEAIVIREITTIISTSPNVSETNLLPIPMIQSLNGQFKRLAMEVESIQDGTLRYRKMNIQGAISADLKRKIEAEATRLYQTLLETPGITACNMVSVLNERLTESLGEPMVTIGKVSYTLEPKNVADELEQDVMTISRIEEEVRARTISFKADLVRKQKEKCPWVLEMSKLLAESRALDETLAELNRDCDEELLQSEAKTDDELTASLKKFADEDKGLRQTCETFAAGLGLDLTREASGEAPALRDSQGRKRNRYGFMPSQPSLFREGQREDKGCVVS